MSLQSAMSVRFNSTGTQLLALRRRLPPVLYELHSRLPSFQFDNQGYFNSCTMKSCCFAGDKDQVGHKSSTKTITSTSSRELYGKKRRAEFEGTYFQCVTVSQCFQTHHPPTHKEMYV